MSNYVVTYQLLTSKQDEDKFNMIYKILSSTYRNGQRKMLRKYKFIRNSKVFKILHNENITLTKDERFAYIQEYNNLLIANGFPIVKPKGSEKKQSRPSNFVDHLFASTTPIKNGGLTEKGKPQSYTIGIYKRHKINVSFLRSVAKGCWNSWIAKINGETSYSGKNQQFIRIDYSEERNTFNTWCFSASTKGNSRMACEYDLKNHIVSLPKVGISCRYKFKGTDYEMFSENDKIVVMAFTRKKIRGKYKYFVQFTLEGIPYNKGRKLGQGKVGIDTSLQRMDVVFENGSANTYSINCIDDYYKIHQLQRKLVRQRIANNPEAYNEKGECIVKHGKYKWKKSKNYIKTQNKIANMQRKTAANRKIKHNIIANDLLAQGSEFHVEALNYSGLQKRAKKTTKNKKGKYNSKRRFGKSIQQGAPASFLTILENKCKNIEGNTFIKVDTSNACTQYDHTNQTFNETLTLKDRVVTLTNGDKVHRDYHAAMNIMYCNNTEHVTKNASYFDNNGINEFYDKFKENLITEKILAY